MPVIAVIGCGRVGLPLSLFIAEKGFRVFGVEKDKEKVAIMNDGKMPFMEKGTQKLLEHNLAQGRFSVTNDLNEVVDKADIFFITLGTALDQDFIPQQSTIRELLLELLSSRKREQPVTIFLRSTIVPGTSKSIFQEMEKRGYIIGKDLFYAYCPERIAEGKSLEELAVHPQVVGAFDTESAARAETFFSQLGISCILGSPIEAELAKLYNNMYRYVNFAFANECMCMAENNEASIINVLKMCNEGYARGGPWLPGYAAGPCLYKDGFFLTSQLLYTDLILSSWKINESLPEVLLREVEKKKDLQKVAILGLAFKAGTDDIRNSLGVKLHRILKNRGVEVAVHDPYADYPEKATNLKEVLNEATEIFVMVPHQEYKLLKLKEITKLSGPSPLIVDPWFIWNNRLITILDS